MREGASEFRERGFCRLPGFLPPARIARLRSICDRVLELWKREQGGDEALRRATNAAFFLQPRYFEGAEEELRELVALITDERVASLVREIAGGDRVFFRNDQYFFEPPFQSFDGAWHRDIQFVARGDEEEKRLLAAGAAAHFRVAFAPDRSLEYVPGSERRWDTEEELTIRRSAETNRAMPGSVVLALDPGDALAFHAWGIHRGRYRVGRERRTLDLIYEWGDTPRAETPRPWITDESWIEELPASARTFFRF